MRVGLGRFYMVVGSAKVWNDTVESARGLALTDSVRNFRNLEVLSLSAPRPHPGGRNPVHIIRIGVSERTSRYAESVRCCRTAGQ